MGKASVIEMIEAHRDALPPAEQDVANYILKNAYHVVDFTVKDLAMASNVSDATVIRMCQHIGFAGYWPMRISLSQELAKYQVDSARAEAGGGVHEILTGYIRMLENLDGNIDHDSVREAVELLRGCGTAHLIAAGNTTPLIEHMAFRLGRVGVKATFSGIPSYFMNQINLSDPEDVILAVSQSGSSKSVIEGVELAKANKRKVIVITAYRNSTLAGLADCLVICKGDFSRFDVHVSYNHFIEMATVDLIVDLMEKSEKTRKIMSEKKVLDLEIHSELKQ